MARLKDGKNRSNFMRKLRSQDSTLISRKPDDSRAFQVEEKFDTWLDLEGLHNFQAACYDKRIWLTEWVKEHSRTVCPESIVELHSAGIIPSDISRCTVTPSIVARLLNHNLKVGARSCYLSNQSFRRHLETVQEAASNNLRLQFDHLTSKCSESFQHDNEIDRQTWLDKIGTLPPEIINMWKLNEDFLKVFSIHRDLNAYVDERNMRKRVLTRLRSVDTSFRCNSINGTFTVSKDIIILHWNEERYLFNKSLFLELLNKSSECLCYLIFNWMQAGTNMPEDQYYHAVSFLNHITSSVAAYQRSTCGDYRPDLDNKGFVYLKAFEGLAVAHIIHITDAERGWVNTDLMQNLWTALREEGIVSHVDFFDSPCYALFSSMHIEQLADLIGCVKLVGHPSIEVEKGLQQLYDRTHAEIRINEESVQRSIGVLTRDLFRNFYLHHKRYPLYNEDALPAEHPVRLLTSRNIDPNSTRGLSLWNRMTHENWAQVRLMKNAEFDPVDNQLTLLKDKALGFQRNKIWPILIGNISSDKAHELLRIEDRRSLLSFLISPSYTRSFSEYLQHYEEDDPWTHAVLNYLVIKLTPKEKEFKPGGRMFGASPQEERNRRIVQELNTMRFMDAYTPDQLLTTNELTTLRKLVSFRYFGVMFPDHVMFQVSFDFSKWNNSMRKEVIDVAGANLLDRWFGKNIWGKTMRAYENALVYYTDKTRQRYWEGQAGGIEGLSQATWSYVFIGGVKSALERIGAIYQLTVKGDDVRAAIAVPRVQVDERGYDGMKQQILNELQHLCQDMGWQLNPQETFVSLSLIATSKQYQVNDTWLPAASKKIYKMMSHANLVFPTLEDTIGSVFSCAHSACSQTTVAMPCYASAIVIACRELYRECSNAMPAKLITPQFLATLSIWPQIIGGPGCLPLQTFFVRGENDILSVSISLFRYVTTIENGPYGELCRRVLLQKLIDKPDMRQLVADPYSLCVDAPERPASVLRRLMRDSMKDWVGNREIQHLLSVEAEADAQALVEHLLSMDPFCNKVITLIWECSPFYIIDEILSKFMQSSSVFEFLKRGRNRTIKTRMAYKRLSLVLEAADTRMRNWIKVLTTPVPEEYTIWSINQVDWADHSICTTKLVHDIRSHAWGQPLVGITYPSLVDQNWIYSEYDIFTDHPTRNVHLGALHLLVNQDAMQFQTPSMSHHYSSIPHNVPWVGSRTATTIELPKTLNKVTSPTLSKVMKLIALRRGGDYLGAEFVQTIDKVLSSLTTIDLAAITTLTPEAGGGHIPHRAAINSYSLSTMPNYRPNLGQIVRVNPDGTFILAGDTADRTINFAARHYYSVIMALFPLQTRMRLPENHPRLIYSILHWDTQIENQYQVCPWCCNIITDQQITFDKPLDIDCYKYQEMALVGASEFEEHILALNLQDAVHGRARRVAELEMLDHTAPIVREIAACMVLRTMNAASRKLYDSCRGANYARIPTGYMAEIMGVVLGHKNIKTVSMNLLRAITPRDLYLALLNETIYVCLDWYRNPDVPIYDCIQHVMRHLNPLEPLFRNILNAGLAARLGDGCRIVSNEFGWDMPPLEWRAGDMSDAHKCSKSFLKHHVPVLEAWIHGGAVLPRLKCFLGMEDDDTIAEAITRMADRFRIALYHKILPVSKNRLISVLIDEVFFTLSNRLHHRFHNNHLIWRDGIPAAWTVEDHHIQVMAGINGGLENEDHAGMLDILARLLLIVNLDETVYEEQRPDHWELVDNVKSDDFQVMVRNEVVPYPWLDRHANDHIGVKTLIERHIHPSVISFMKDLFVFRCEMNCDTMLIILDEAEMILDEIWPTLDCINYYSLGVMTNEDAERVLKSTPEEMLGWLEEQRVHERFVVGEIVDMHIDVIETCRVPNGRESHDTHLALPLLMYRDANGDMEHNLLDPALPIVRPIDEIYEPRFDWIDIVRCAGHQNTSVCKYAELFDQLDTLDVVNVQVPNPVVLCLADGIGGVTAHLLRVAPDAIVFYNSLQVLSDTGETPSDASVQHPPIECMAAWVQGHHRARLRWKGYYPGDLCSEGVVQAYIRDARAAGNTALITCDADRQWHLPHNVYYTLVINVIRIAIELLSEVGQCIIKMFLVNDPGLSRIIRFVQTHYEHVHIIRCQATRSHSSEVFLFFGKVKNRDIARHQCMHILDIAKVMPTHLESEAYILRRTNDIMELITLFRETGRINTNLTYDHIFDVYQRAGLPPLSVAHLLSSVDSDKSLHIPHVCRFSESIIRYCKDRKDQMIAMIVALDRRRRRGQGIVIRRPKRITAAGGTPLAHGWSIDEQWIRNLLIVETTGSMVHYLTSYFDDGEDIPWGRLITDIEGAMMLITNNDELDVDTRYREDGHFICVRGNVEWDMSLVTRRNALRVFRLYGSFLYMTWLIHHHIAVANNVVRDWMLHTDIQQCCIDYSRDFWVARNPGQIPVVCESVIQADFFNNEGVDDEDGEWADGN